MNGIRPPKFINCMQFKLSFLRTRFDARVDKKSANHFPLEEVEK